MICLFCVCFSFLDWEGGAGNRHIVLVLVPMGGGGGEGGAPALPLSPTLNLESVFTLLMQFNYATLTKYCMSISPLQKFWTHTYSQ